MSTRRAFAFSFADRYVGIVVHTISAMVIARLLSPPEIGVYSLTMVLVTFIATFRDLGAGQYLVQKKELSVSDIRDTWAVQLGLGILFALLIAGGSLPVAAFYNEPRMIDIMLVLAANFALTPFQALPYAWLMRAMRFDILALMRMASALVQAACGIGLAWGGVGPISLAWANLAATVAGVAIALTSVGGQLPWKPRMAGIARVVSFGGRLTAIGALGTVRSAAPELFLGRFQGMTETGLFSRGQGLVVMFERLIMDAVNAVALPMYAKELREGRAISATFLRAASLVTALGWSLLAFIGVLAFPVIRVLYGPQWDETVDPTRWLAAAMALGVPGYVCVAPVIAAGAVAPLLRVTALSTLVAIACSSIGAYMGLLPLSQLMLAAAAVASVSALYVAKPQARFDWAPLLRVFAASALLAAAASIVPVAVTVAFGPRPQQILLSLAIAVPGSIAGFCVAAYLTRHPCWEELLRAGSHLIASVRIRRRG
jgi:O-antigen/teichoic acid export membrane protein